MCAKYGQLALRLAVAGVFMYHGGQKLFTQTEGIAGFFDKIGIPMAGLMVYAVGAVEFFGGLAIALGLFTRLAALGHVIIMLVAILVAKGLSSWKAIELDVMLLAASINFMLGGAGDLSIDAMMAKKSGATPAPAAKSEQKSA